MRTRMLSGSNARIHRRHRRQLHRLKTHDQPEPILSREKEPLGKINSSSGQLLLSSILQTMVSISYHRHIYVEGKSSDFERVNKDNLKRWIIGMSNTCPLSRISMSIYSSGGNNSTSSLQLAERYTLYIISEQESRTAASDQMDDAFFDVLSDLLDTLDSKTLQPQALSITAQPSGASVFVTDLQQHAKDGPKHGDRFMSNEINHAVKIDGFRVRVGTHQLSLHIRLHPSLLASAPLARHSSLQSPASSLHFISPLNKHPIHSSMKPIGEAAAMKSDDSSTQSDMEQQGFDKLSENEMQICTSMEDTKTSKFQSLQAECCKLNQNDDHSTFRSFQTIDSGIHGRIHTTTLSESETDFERPRRASRKEKMAASSRHAIWRKLIHAPDGLSCSDLYEQLPSMRSKSLRDALHVLVQARKIKRVRKDGSKAVIYMHRKFVDQVDDDNVKLLSLDEIRAKEAQPLQQPTQRCRRKRRRSLHRIL